MVKEVTNRSSAHSPRSLNKHGVRSCGGEVTRRCLACTLYLQEMYANRFIYIHYFFAFPSFNLTSYINPVLVTQSSFNLIMPNKCCVAAFKSGYDSQEEKNVYIFLLGSEYASKVAGKATLRRPNIFWHKEINESVFQISPSRRLCSYTKDMKTQAFCMASSVIAPSRISLGLHLLHLQLLG